MRDELDFNLHNPDMAYGFGYKAGIKGSPWSPAWEQYINAEYIRMGYKDAQGDQYIEIVAPPKPPLDLSNNETIMSYTTPSERAAIRQYMQDDRKQYLAKLAATKGRETLREAHQKHLALRKWLDTKRKK